MTHRERDCDGVDVVESVFAERVVLRIEEAVGLQHVAAVAVLLELASVDLHGQICT